MIDHAKELKTIERLIEKIAKYLNIKFKISNALLNWVKKMRSNSESTKLIAEKGSRGAIKNIAVENIKL